MSKKSKGKSNNTLKQMTTETQLKTLGCSKSSPKREFYRSTILPEETRKTSNRQPNFTSETPGKRRTKKSQN